MAKNSIRDFSATAGSNTDIQSVNIDENCPASGINNAIRELMVDLKNVSTGAVNLETPAADSLTVTGDLTVDTSTLKVDAANNRVGISTASPTAPLHLSTSASGDIAILNTSANSGTGLFINSQTANQIDVVGYDGSAANAVNIRSGGASGAGLNVTTANKIGINTTSPDAMLQVQNGDITVGWADNFIGAQFQDGSAFRLGMKFGTVNRTTKIVAEASDNNGEITFETNGAERMRIDSDGRLLLRKTSGVTSGSCVEMERDMSSGVAMEVNNTASSGTHNAIHFRRGGTVVGKITNGPAATGYVTTSDYRLKQGIVDMTGAIDRVKQLAPKRFNFIVDADTTVDGFLAHEAQTVVPEAVTGTHNEVETWTQQQIDDGDAPDGTSAGDNKLDGDGNTIPVMQGIDQSKLVPLLTAALKESIAKIETLETEMTALKARVTALEA